MSNKSTIKPNREEKAQESRKKILQAAEEVFAESGFEGGRVDEIARRAGVNKALLYYYFKSKRALLDELYLNFYKESVEMVQTRLEEEGSDLESFFSESVDGFLEHYLDFLEERSDLLRVILMESLKKGQTPQIFTILGQANEHQEKMLRLVTETNLAFRIKDPREVFVIELFTGRMPMILYTIWADPLSDLLRVDRETLKKWFISAYTNTHIAYHRGGPSQ